MKLYAHRFDSPLGELFTAVREDGAVVRLEFLRGQRVPAGRRPPRSPGTEGLEWDAGRGAAVERALDEYFRRERRSFDLPLEPQGTEFQRRIWEALVRIPYGRTESYGELAARAGVPRAVRAAGAANGANPIVIVIPCHRVIGADGSLTGFGAGLERKRALLELESGQGVLL